VKSINIPLDISILLHSDGSINLYVGDEELPSYEISLIELVDELVDSMKVNDRIHPNHEDEAYELIKHFREAITTITTEMPD
jgi:hypothetical protein